MKRIVYVCAILVAACAEREPTTAPMPQHDHTSATYPSDPSVGAMNATQLTSWAGIDRSPTWSPDGSRIAFASSRFTTATSIATSIYVMNADGSGVVRITTGTVDGQPTWSPDGSTIVFVRFGGIYRVASAGGPVTMMIPQGSGASDPRYSPDGARIAYTRNNQVFVMASTGGAAVQVTPDGPLNAYPEWLDANTLIYTQTLGSDESVWKITVGDPTSATRLTPAEASFFRFADMTSDASVLAFTSNTNLVFQDMSTGLHTAGNMSVQPTTDPAAANVEFSADGQRVLFVARGATPTELDIYVADVPTLRSNVDATAPVVTETVTGTLGQNGWYTADVTVHFDVADAESGIASQTGCADTVVNTDGTSIDVTCTATNGAGLVTTKTVSLKRDATAPVITFVGQTSYALDEQVDITCSAADATSGVASTSCPAVASGPAWTFAPSNTRTATAVDSAGNGSSQDVTFTVNANMAGLSGLVAQFVQDKGVANSLNAKLSANQLNAFLNELSAQTGKALSPEEADVLIHWVMAVEPQSFGPPRNRKLK